MRILNRKAKFNFHLLETFEAGVALTGQEVKSIRSGRVNLSESFAKIQNHEVFLKNAYIYPYQGHTPEYNPTKDRKLLLRREQIDHLQSKISASSITLIPLEIYETRNMFKVKLALAASKKKFDKKRAMKEKEEKRKIEQELRLNKLESQT